ncbi:hypothetical protein WICANDRAFT_77639 [Wickerhamomyces anomalus NRRL Y-366-8]|uniref:DNA polymerase delta subunit 3 n=1 Tax=Wickerhamomyces anomalus (strain ATCC 58044 / CBS 1984 / NCYC 433 / NRRL Y-366-8) TaxID=683960 RepID=A0A1E3P6D2_WICAA|nr:uncharacterized protein WICANDRAFT_77639 [Wickerhamomyces anomalus NRRL Y-366-8]ODQ60976.1 hypothetical protein WICANDRAFT_77639 [Wickerhamomyces anomalus NRRL Y-366-8]
MGVLEDSNEILKTAVLKENKPYTYKLLSRHLDIHVNDAKKLLYTFYKNHKDLVEATFLISGTFGGETDLKIKVTKDLKDREKFDQVQSIQVYSLSPQNIKIDEIVSTVNAQLQEFNVDESKLAKWGLIKGPELVKIASQTTKEPSRSNTSISTTKKPEAKAPASAPSKKKEFPDMGLRSAQILNRNRTKEKEEPKARTNTQPTFASSSKQTKAKQQPRSKTEPAKKVQQEDLADEVSLKKQKESNAEKDRKQKELESMFDDDDDDDVVIQEADEAEKEATETPTTAANKNEDLEGLFDSSFSQSQSQPNKKEVEEQPEEVQPEEPDVVEDEKSQEDKKDEGEVTSYYDEDGYLVTKVAEKPKTKPKPKPKAREAPASSSAPVTKKAKPAAKGGAKQQSSLMSFFGKK